MNKITPSVPWDELSPEEELSRAELMMMSKDMNKASIAWVCPFCDNHYTYDYRSIEEISYFVICHACQKQSEWRDVFVEDIRLSR